MNLILTSDTHYGVDGKTHGKHERFWRDMQKDIVANDVKALIWAGDLASSKQRQFRRSVEQAREHVSIPILLVRGNHDFWDARDSLDAGRRSFPELDRLHREVFSEFNVHHLESGPVTIEDVLICGWDGWYAGTPPSNDANFMFRDYEGVPMHTYLSSRAWKKFEEVMDLDVSPHRTAVAVTHFNPYCTDRKWESMCANLKFYDMVKEKFDVFCCGHNHQFKDRVEDGCRVLNCGSDYNKPQYLMFEV